MMQTPSAHPTTKYHMDGSGAVGFGCGKQIFVKTLVGKTITIDVNDAMKTDEIKEKIQDKDGTPMEYQVLTFNGKIMEQGYMVGDYSILKEDTVHVSARLVGSMFTLPSNVHQPEVLMETMRAWATRLNELEAQNVNSRKKCRKRADRKASEKLFRMAARN